MAIKRIGLDFDKVLVEYPPVIPYSVITFFYRYGLVPIKRDNPGLTYRLPGPFEQKIRLLTHFSFLRRPIEDNILALKELSGEKNTELYLVSGRFGFLEKKTMELMREYGLKKYFKKIFFNFENHQPHEFKLELIKKLGIGFFIDDDIEILLYLTKKTTGVKYFWITPDKKSPSKKIEAIKNLEEFYTIYTKKA